MRVNWAAAALAVAATIFGTSGCIRKAPDPLLPVEPAVQIVIPDTPGWSPGNNDVRAYNFFDRSFKERLRDANGVVTKSTWHLKDMKIVLTLYGQPDQIETVTVPFLRRAGLPAGTTVVKYYGGKNPRHDAVQIGS